MEQCKNKKGAQINRARGGLKAEDTAGRQVAGKRYQFPSCHRHI